MYLLDEQNRTAILEAVEKRIAEFQPLPFENSAEPEEGIQTVSKTILFLEVLKPMNGNPDQTLEFIRQKVEEAGFEFNLFSQVPRLENGKNPYGLNGCIAAMIDYFYQLNYLRRNIPWSRSSKHTCNIPVIQSGS